MSDQDALANRIEAVLASHRRLLAWQRKFLASQRPANGTLSLAFCSPQHKEGLSLREMLKQTLETASAVCSALANQAQALRNHADPTASAAALQSLVQALQSVLAILRQAERLKRGLRKARPAGLPKAIPHPVPDGGSAKPDVIRKPQADKLGLSFPEAARLLNVSTKTLRKWVRQYDLPCIRLGRSVRIPLDGLRAWVEEQARRGEACNGGNGD